MRPDDGEFQKYGTSQNMDSGNTISTLGASTLSNSAERKIEVRGNSKNVGPRVTQAGGRLSILKKATDDKGPGEEGGSLHIR